MIRKAVVVMSLAGAACWCSGAITLRIEADRTIADLGEVVTWTVSLTGITDPTHYVRDYDLSFEPSDFSSAQASTFTTALSPLVAPEGGNPLFARLRNVSGGQSSIVDPLNLTFGDVVLGTFTTTVLERVTTLEYDVQDGGNLGTDHFRVNAVDDLSPAIFTGRPDQVISDSVLFFPAPGAATCLAALGFIAVRRRR